MSGNSQLSKALHRAKARDKKRTPTMKVSGQQVKMLAKILSSHKQRRKNE